MRPASGDSRMVANARATTLATMQILDVRSFRALRAAVSTWGACSLAFGTLAIAGVAYRISSAWPTGLEPMELASILVVGSLALVAVACGLHYWNAGSKLGAVTRSGSPDAAIAGVDALGRAFKLEAIVTGLAIALTFSFGAVWGAVSRL
jgi:hypothetical protein